MSSVLLQESSFNSAVEAILAASKKKNDNAELEMFLLMVIAIMRLHVQVWLQNSWCQPLTIIFDADSELKAKSYHL